MVKWSESRRQATDLCAHRLVIYSQLIGGRRARRHSMLCSPLGRLRIDGHVFQIELLLHTCYIY